MEQYQGKTEYDFKKDLVYSRRSFSDIYYFMPDALFVAVDSDGKENIDGDYAKFTKNFNFKISWRIK